MTSGNVHQANDHRGTVTSHVTEQNQEQPAHVLCSEEMVQIFVMHYWMEFTLAWLLIFQIYFSKHYSIRYVFSISPIILPLPLLWLICLLGIKCWEISVCLSNHKKPMSKETTTDNHLNKNKSYRFGDYLILT